MNITGNSCIALDDSREVKRFNYLHINMILWGTGFSLPEEFYLQFLISSKWVMLASHDCRGYSQGLIFYHSRQVKKVIYLHINMILQRARFSISEIFYLQILFACPNEWHLLHTIVENIHRGWFLYYLSRGRPPNRWCKNIQYCEILWCNRRIESRGTHLLPIVSWSFFF